MNTDQINAPLSVPVEHLINVYAAQVPALWMDAAGLWAIFAVLVMLALRAIKRAKEDENFSGIVVTTTVVSAFTFVLAVIALSVAYTASLSPEAYAISKILKASFSLEACAIGKILNTLK